jgi:hypothetical protein
LENWTSAYRRLKLDPCLSLYTDINSKWIKYLNRWPETLKLLQERAGNTLEHVGISNNFLNRNPNESLWNQKASAQQKKKKRKKKCYKSKQTNGTTSNLETFIQQDTAS